MVSVNDDFFSILTSCSLAVDSLPLISNQILAWLSPTYRAKDKAPNLFRSLLQKVSNTW